MDPYLDPYPDPDSQSELESGSRSRRAKMRSWMFSFEGWRLSCSLDVLYGGLGISKCNVWSKKIENYFNFFFSFWSSEPCIRIHNTRLKSTPNPGGKPHSQLQVHVQILQVEPCRFSILCLPYWEREHTDVHKTFPLRGFIVGSVGNLVSLFTKYRTLANRLVGRICTFYTADLQWCIAILYSMCISYANVYIGGGETNLFFKRSKCQFLWRLA